MALLSYSYPVANRLLIYCTNENNSEQDDNTDHNKMMASEKREHSYNYNLTNKSQEKLSCLGGRGESDNDNRIFKAALPPTLSPTYPGVLLLKS